MLGRACWYGLAGTGLLPCAGVRQGLSRARVWVWGCAIDPSRGRVQGSALNLVHAQGSALNLVHARVRA